MAEYAFFLQKADQWKKDMALLWGDINICPSLHGFQLPCHSQVKLSSLNGIRAWGEGQTSCHNITFLLVLTRKEATGDRKYGLSTVWVNPSQARGPLYEGSGWETDHLGLQWTQLALHPGAVTWGHPPCTTPQGGALGHPTSERDRSKSLWANQPTGGLPTPCHWCTSCLPCRAEWIWQTCYNLPTRATGLWGKSHCWQACLPGNWYPAIPDGGARLKGTTSWWGPHHYDSQPP